MVATTTRVLTATRIRPSGAYDLKATDYWCVCHEIKATSDLCFGYIGDWCSPRGLRRCLLLELCDQGNQLRVRSPQDQGDIRLMLCLRIRLVLSHVSCGGAVAMTVEKRSTGAWTQKATGDRSGGIDGGRGRRRSRDGRGGNDGGGRGRRRYRDGRVGNDGGGRGRRRCRDERGLFCLFSLLRETMLILFREAIAKFIVNFV